MIFSELYSAYYQAVAKILKKAAAGELTERDIVDLSGQYAFAESPVYIRDALKSQRWQLIREDLTTPLQAAPAMPLTNLEKRWLKAILADPRVQLFDLKIPGLEDTVPLFTPADYRIYDQYGDADPFTDPGYITRFRLILRAIREAMPIHITMRNRFGKICQMRFQPRQLEYSEKDGKFRVLGHGGYLINLGRILDCSLSNHPVSPRTSFTPDRTKEILLEIENEHNALERVMLHFSHFEKQTERIGENRYRVQLKYLESDEAELVIRVLSFGPRVVVKEPETFVNLIRNKLISQKACKIR